MHELEADAVGDREGGAEPTQTAHAVPAGSVLTA